jgi:hypothetical protein
MTKLGSYKFKAKPQIAKCKIVLLNATFGRGVVLGFK